MPYSNIVQMQSTLSANQRLDKSKPSKKKLKTQAALAATNALAMTYVIDKFDKKFVMTDLTKNIRTGKALESFINISNKVDDVKTNIKNSIKTLLGKTYKHFTPDKKIRKILSKPSGFVKKYANRLLAWTLNLSKSAKWFGGITAVALAAKYLKDSGRVEGKHQAINTIAKADNLIRLS